jgi:hypothetical protein
MPRIRSGVRGKDGDNVVGGPGQRALRRRARIAAALLLKPIDATT